MLKIPKIGDVYLVEFTGKDHEIRGWHPAVITQNNTGNKYSPNVIVIPITSRTTKRYQKTHVYISSQDSGLLKDSIVQCEQITTCSKNKLGKYITTLPNYYMEKIGESCLTSIPIVCFVDDKKLSALIKDAREINNICYA